MAVEVPTQITIPVTQEMLADLKDGTEVGFTWEGSGCEIRIVMSPAFSALVIDIEEIDIEDTCRLCGAEMQGGE